MPTGAELFVRAMQELGLREIFTLVGDHLNAVLLEAARCGIRIVDMRHESAVMHAADVWARVHRRPALGMVTGGPGHTNAVTGIATTFQAASPLLAVSGARAWRLADRQAFQELDQLGLVRPIVKWAAQPPRAADLGFYLGRAYAEAMAGRMGPAHLTIPVDLFEAETDGATPVPVPLSPPRPAPSGADVARALSLLEEAERPVVIAGSGVWWSRAEDEILEFVERTQLPLWTITMARCAIPDDHPLTMGYADPSLNRAALTALRQADVVLVLGKRLDYRLAFGGPRLFAPAARFIQVDIHAPELGMNRRLEVGLCADVRATLRAFLDHLGAKRWTPRPWLERVRQLRRKWRQHLENLAAQAEPPMHPLAVFAELERSLPPQTLYSWDGGDFCHWGRAYLPARRSPGWIRLGPLGTIGAALPNAVALKLAHPDEPVVLITGDGALGFYLAELDTLVRHELPVVIVVGNDAGWGIERELQRAAGGDRTVACELRPTRYDLVMQACGGAGEHVENVAELRAALQRAWRASVPYLIDVRVRGARSPFTEWQIAGKTEAPRALGPDRTEES